mmetsp:Transcript_16313/g.40184  ORF Transcript_16313/g.40184 Transcript_16313/m.40184 type:complete len:208 (-) Transcript_16313:446-1069(-)
MTTVADMLSLDPAALAVFSSVCAAFFGFLVFRSALRTKSAACVFGTALHTPSHARIRKASSGTISRTEMSGTEETRSALNFRAGQEWCLWAFMSRSPMARVTLSRPLTLLFSIQPPAATTRPTSSVCSTPWSTVSGTPLVPRPNTTRESPTLQVNTLFSETTPKVSVVPGYDRDSCDASITLLSTYLTLNRSASSILPSINSSVSTK